MEEEALSVLAKRPFERTAEEVQALASWLTAHCCPFFGSMRQDVVEHLCTFMGHAWVEEGRPVYAQGQVGDSLYVVAKGYCAVVKHPDTSASSSNSSVPGPGPACGAGGSSRSSCRNSTGSQPVSRRATVELQVQQFALASGSADVPSSFAADKLSKGVSGQLSKAASAVANELPISLVAPGSATTPAGVVAARRRTTGTLPAAHALTPGSRRVTAEQAIQQQIAESTHLGWLTQGESFGEAALVNPGQQRPVSVVAGDGGVRLVVLDRSCYCRLTQQAHDKQPLAAAVLQAVLAAACKPLLRVGSHGKGRTAEDVETLAELFSGLEAFKCLPQQVRDRLAKACQGLQLPSGAVVFEEDDKGDAMYVVVSGTCQVRARPLQPGHQASESVPQAGCQDLSGIQPEDKQDPGSVATSGNPNRGMNTTEGGGIWGSRDNAEIGDSSAAGRQLPRRYRATTDAAVGPTVREMKPGLGPLQRRTTWEGVAFTPQEQARLEAVKAALEAEKQQVCPFPGKDASSQASSLVERDGLFWTAKFMSEAATAATASDPHWGLEGGMTPLAAVFAAKWRQQARQQAAEKHAQAAGESDAAAADKAYAAMEELLGKAAARAWKAARGGAAAADITTAASKQAPTADTSDAISGSGTGNHESCNSESSGGNSSVEPRTPARADIGNAAENPAADVELSAELDTHAHAGAPAAVRSSQNQQGSSAASKEASEAPTPAQAPCSPRTAAAAAARLLAAASSASDPADAVKLHLAALGVKDPADVSRMLLAELGARANLEGLLGSVATFLEHRGLPRRLNKKGSLKITKELNKRMLAGASGRGFGKTNSHRPGQLFNQQQEEAPDQYNDCSKQPRSRHTLSFGTRNGPGDSQHPGAGCCNSNGSVQEGQGPEDGALAEEATGTSSGDWRSSLDGSEAASLCLSMDADGDKCLLDSMDLAASSDMRTSAPAAYASNGDLAASSSSNGTPYQQHAYDRIRDNNKARQQDGGSTSRSSRGLKAHLRLSGPMLEEELSKDSPESLSPRYGPVVRTLGTGDSFGELALLQRSATRTATVVVAHDWPEGAEADPAAPAAAHEGGALLIKISRSCYDATVRALQVSALEDMLSFLSGLPPFSGLSRELLTSLAVFAKSVTVQPGQVLALAGCKTEGLTIIQEGDVKLIDACSHSAGNDTDCQDSSLRVGPSVLQKARRSTADALVTTGSQQYLLQRQLSRPKAQSDGGAKSWRSGSVRGSAVGSSSGGGCDSLIAGVGLRRQQQQLLSGVQLGVLGPGSLLGENVLGYNPDEDPLSAIASASSRKAQQAAAAAAAALTHPVTAVALRPCKLLLLAAEDLRRFGRHVRAPLAGAAADRREWLQQRRGAVQSTLASAAQATPTPGQQQQLAPGVLAANLALISGRATPVHGLPGVDATGANSVSPQCQRPSNHSNSTSCNNTGGLLAGSSGSTSEHHSSSCSSTNGLWPGLANLLAPQGSASAATMAMMRRRSSRDIAAAVRCQWQQQQWQQAAYGELLHSQQPSLQGQQQVMSGDVARLKQTVPAMQPPCVSELAAAARPFPAGMLCATSVAAAGRDGAKGLQLLLPDAKQLSTLSPRLGAAGSPKWVVGLEDTWRLLELLQMMRHLHQAEGLHWGRSCLDAVMTDASLWQSVSACCA